MNGPTGYFKDAYFHKYFDTMTISYIKTGDIDYIAELRDFLLSGACSWEQAEYMLGHGCFSDEASVSYLKSIGLISPSYKVPDGIIPFLSLTGLPESNPLTGVYNGSHTFDMLDADTEASIYKMVTDKVSGNAYAEIRGNIGHKYISGAILRESAKAKEPLSITFSNNEGEELYTWTFDKVYYYDNDYLDIAVENGSGILRYNLGTELPEAATLSINMNEKNTPFTFNDDLGNYLFEKTSDDNGTIKLDVTRSGNYRYVITDLSANPVTSVQEYREVPKVYKMPSNKAGLWAAVSLTAVAIIFCITGLISFKKKKGKKMKITKLP